MSQLILLTLPIGNLSDLSPRVRAALGDKKNIFVAEDTRNLKKIAQLLEISLEGYQIIAYHDHDRSAEKKVIESLKSGRSVYLVSDAGSPMISDPGYPLVSEVLAHGFDITTFPGPSAVIAAIELSGLPPHPFVFHGFSPRDEKRRAELFDECLNMTTCRESRSLTHVFYESPHRIEKSLALLADRDRESWEISVALCREITKKFETTYRFRAQEFEQLKENWQIKGECVLVFHAKAAEQEQAESFAGKKGKKVQKLAQECLDAKAHPKAVSKLVAEILDLAPKETYNRMKR